MKKKSSICTFPDVNVQQEIETDEYSIRAAGEGKETIKREVKIKTVFL